MNREYVLKNFFNKVNLLKKQSTKELKLSYEEANDLSLCISEIMSENYSKASEIVKRLETINMDSFNETIELDGGGLKKEVK